jgi:hypothetical protein
MVNKADHYPPNRAHVYLTGLNSRLFVHPRIQVNRRVSMGICLFACRDQCVKAVLRHYNVQCQREAGERLVRMNFKYTGLYTMDMHA